MASTAARVHDRLIAHVVGRPAAAAHELKMSEPPVYQSDEGGPDAGKIELYSGARGAKLRTITSTTAGENLGFDVVGVGDVNRDHRPDLLSSAAEGDTVYMIAGSRRR